MFNNLRYKHVLSPRLLDNLANTLEKELYARYQSSTCDKHDFLNIQKVLDAIKPVSNIRTNILKNYRFKN